MSTRSRIGIYNARTKRTKSIYCHFDGYLSNNGAILNEHYTRREKVNKMMSLGDMSGLEERNRPPGKGKQTFNRNCKGRHFDNASTFYIDRGEYKPATKGMISSEYQYLYYKGDWYIRIRATYVDYYKLTENVIELAYQKYAKLSEVLKIPYRYGF